MNIKTLRLIGGSLEYDYFIDMETDEMYRRKATNHGMWEKYDYSVQLIQGINRWLTYEH